MAEQPPKQKSLSEIATEAGFYNFVEKVAGHYRMSGLVTSDKFEIFYFRFNQDRAYIPLNLTEEEKKTGISSKRRILNEGTIDIFCVRDQYEPESTALFKIPKKWFSDEFHEPPIGPGQYRVNLDKEEPYATGEQAAAIMLAYATQLKAAKLAADVKKET